MKRGNEYRRTEIERCMWKGQYVMMCRMRCVQRRLEQEQWCPEWTETICLSLSIMCTLDSVGISVSGVSFYEWPCVCEHGNGSSSALMTIIRIMDSQTKLMRENFLRGKKKRKKCWLLISLHLNQIWYLKSLSLREIWMCWEVVSCLLFFHITGYLS